MDVPVCMYKSENCAQSQQNFARKHVRVTVTFKTLLEGTTELSNLECNPYNALYICLQIGLDCDIVNDTMVASYLDSDSSSHFDSDPIN